MGFAIGGPSKGPELEDVDNRSIALAAARKLIAAAQREREPVSYDSAEMSELEMACADIEQMVYDVGVALVAAVILAEHWAAERERS